MSSLELIDRLCEITRLQADIIEKQALALEQANIDLETGETLHNQREYVKSMFDTIT